MLVTYRLVVGKDDSIVIVVLQDLVTQTEAEVLRMFTYSDFVLGAHPMQTKVTFKLGHHDKLCNEEGNGWSRIS